MQKQDFFMKDDDSDKGSTSTDTSNTGSNTTIAPEPAMDPNGTNPPSK